MALGSGLACLSDSSTPCVGEGDAKLYEARELRLTCGLKGSSVSNDPKYQLSFSAEVPWLHHLFALLTFATAFGYLRFYCPLACENINGVARINENDTDDRNANCSGSNVENKSKLPGVDII